VATTYRFQVSMPQVDALPRNLVTNTFHMSNVGTGGLLATDLEAMCDAICDLWQKQYKGSPGNKVTTKAYSLSAASHAPPLAQATRGTSNWGAACPREVALCLSFAKRRSVPRERGRLYLSPGMVVGGQALFTYGAAPPGSMLDWALELYGKANQSLPDLGGIDWKFGVFSPTNSAFYQTTEAWVDNEWDTVRSRGPGATTRVSSVRDG
jgi:hypothetical protein